MALATRRAYIAFDDIWGNDTDVMEANGYLSDNSHPTELGSRRIAEKVAQTLALNLDERTEHHDRAIS